MKRMDLTASQAEILTAPFAGEISAQAVSDAVQAGMGCRFAFPFAEEVKEVCGLTGQGAQGLPAGAAEKGGPVIIVNMAADDADAPISAFLAGTQADKLQAAFAALKEAAGAEEAYLVRTEDMELDLAGAETVIAGRSLVLREESALCHWIQTGELRSCPLPKDFVSEGLDGRPTVMADAETLVRLYAAAQAGYEETKLVAVRTPEGTQIGEFKTGTSLADILAEAGAKTEKSILLGGLTGRFVTAADAAELKVDTTALWDFVGIYGPKDCMADLTASLAARSRQETCQKCVLCREGTWHFENIFSQVTAGKAKKDDLAMVEDIGPLIHVGSFCSFGQGMAELFVSSVETNRKEMEAHFVKKSCPAGVCKAFSKPVIDPAKCTGCTDCLDVCDEDAISGKRKFIHIIDPDMCENCGKCAEVCEEGAIVPQDGSIRVPKKPVRVGKF